MLGKSGFSIFRKAAYLSGVAVLAAAGLAGSGLYPNAEAREAAGLFAQFQPRDPFAQPAQVNPRLQQPQRPPLRPRQAPKQVGKDGGKQAEKKEPPPPPGPHVLIISVKSQRVTLYANGKNVAQSPISTGTATHPTPHGVFSIIQRNRHHKSNIYSGAPMPYMQRLTWSGVALHQGALPGYPASHGCIRLPEQFANFLWRTTKMNTRVIVSRDDVEPQEIMHAKLFQPKPVPTTVENPLPELRKTFDTTHSVFVRTAGMTMVVTDAVDEETDAKPLNAIPQAVDDAVKADADQPTLQSAPAADDAAKIDAPEADLAEHKPADPQADEPAKPEIAEQAPSDAPDVAKPEVVDAKPVEPEAPAAEPIRQELAAPQPEPAKVDPARQEIAAPQPEPEKVEPAKPELAASPPAKPEPRIESKIETNAEITATAFPKRADIPDTILASFERSLVAKEKRTAPRGPISVFISRKDKRIYVRQTFIPLFTASVSFKDENVPFGTHVFTAYDKDDGKALRWTAVTMPAESAVQEKPKTVVRFDAYGRKIEAPVKPQAKQPPKHETHAAVPSAASVLDRIEIPQDVVERISEYMSAGASLIISDHGIGDETGLYTDFIVVTKK